MKELMARLGGLEPPARCLEGSCSVYTSRVPNMFQIRLKLAEAMAKRLKTKKSKKSDKLLTLQGKIWYSCIL